MWLAPCVLLAAFFLASGKLLANSSEPFIDDHEILELDFLQVQNFTANEIIEIQDNQEPEESLVIQENKIYDEVEVIPELYLDYAENSTIFKLDDDIDIQDLTRIGLEEDFPDRKSRGVIYGFDVDESNWNGFVTEKFIFSRNWNPNTTLQTPAVFGIVASKDTLATSRFVRQVYGPNRNQRPQEYQQSDEHHEESGAYALKDGSNLSYEVEADSREELKLHQDGSYERNREGHGKAYRKRVGPLRYSVEKVGERVEEQKVLEVRKRKQRVCNGLRTGARIICKDNGKCAFINLGKKYCQYLSHPYCVLEAVCVMKGHSESCFGKCSEKQVCVYRKMNCRGSDNNCPLEPMCLPLFAESTVQEEKKWKVLRKIVPDYQIAMQQSESEEAEEFDYKSQESGYGNKHENRESAEENDYGNKYQNRESPEEDDHDETESGGHHKKEEFRETLRGCSGVNVVCELACPSENQCGLLREIKSFCHFIKHPQCIIPPVCTKGQKIRCRPHEVGIIDSNNSHFYCKDGLCFARQRCLPKHRGKDNAYDGLKPFDVRNGRCHSHHLGRKINCMHDHRCMLATINNRCKNYHSSECQLVSVCAAGDIRCNCRPNQICVIDAANWFCRNPTACETRLICINKAPEYTPQLTEAGNKGNNQDNVIPVPEPQLQPINENKNFQQGNRFDKEPFANPQAEKNLRKLPGNDEENHFAGIIPQRLRPRKKQRFQQRPVAKETEVRIPVSRIDDDDDDDHGREESGRLPERIREHEPREKYPQEDKIYRENEEEEYSESQEEYRKEDNYYDEPHRKPVKSHPHPHLGPHHDYSNLKPDRRHKDRPINRGPRPIARPSYPKPPVQEYSQEIDKEEVSEQREEYLETTQKEDSYEESGDKGYGEEPKPKKCRGLNGGEPARCDPNEHCGLVKWLSKHCKRNGYQHCKLDGTCIQGELDAVKRCRRGDACVIDTYESVLNCNGNTCTALQRLITDSSYYRSEEYQRIQGLQHSRHMYTVCRGINTKETVSCRIGEKCGLLLTTRGCGHHGPNGCIHRPICMRGEATCHNCDKAHKTCALDGRTWFCAGRAPLPRTCHVKTICMNIKPDRSYRQEEYNDEKRIDYDREEYDLVTEKYKEDSYQEKTDDYQEEYREEKVRCSVRFSPGNPILCDKGLFCVAAIPFGINCAGPHPKHCPLLPTCATGENANLCKHTKCGPRAFCILQRAGPCGENQQCPLSARCIRPRIEFNEHHEDYASVEEGYQEPGGPAVARYPKNKIERLQKFYKACSPRGTPNPGMCLIGEKCERVVAWDDRCLFDRRKKCTKFTSACQVEGNLSCRDVKCAHKCIMVESTECAEFCTVGHRLKTIRLSCPPIPFCLPGLILQKTCPREPLHLPKVTSENYNPGAVRDNYLEQPLDDRLDYQNPVNRNPHQVPRDYPPVPIRRPHNHPPKIPYNPPPTEIDYSEPLPLNYVEPRPNPGPYRKPNSIRRNPGPYRKPNRIEPNPVPGPYGDEGPIIGPIPYY